MTSETFEQVLSAAEAAGSLTPAWKKFVNTRFFVPVVRIASNDPTKFKLNIAPGQDGAPAVHISEVRERLDPQQGANVSVMTGADVVKMLGADGAILVSLADRVFDIARERVDWLKKGIEASQARAAAKAAEAASPSSIAAPVTVTAPVSMVKPAAPVPAANVAPAPPPVRRNVPLDVAALKPRPVSLPKVGLEFFVPAKWTEVKDPKGLRFTDTDSGILVVASGSHKPDMSLHQWQGLRMQLVQHEMRYLTQAGEPYAIDGDGWRDRVKGTAVEYTGTFPGDDFPSRYLVACIRIEGTVAVITVRAPADAFEDNRALFKWMLGRVDLLETSAIEARGAIGGGSSAGGGSHGGYGEYGEAVSVLGFSLQGRISRMQAMAYSFAVALPVVVVSIVMALLAPKSMYGAMIMIGVAGVVTMWFALRLLVLRLHDINRSGWWIVFIPALAIVFGLLRMHLLAALTAGLFWFAMLIVYCLVPGSNDDNDFGPPPAENSGWVQFGALLFILLNAASITGSYKMSKMQGGFRNPMMTQSTSQESDDAGDDGGVQNVFMPGDHAFVVNMPGTPRRLPRLPQDDKDRLLQYQLVTPERSYLLQSLDYGSTPVDRAGAMEALQAEIIGNNGTLISSKAIFLNGLKGREVMVQLPNGVVRGSRYVITDTKLCQVMITASASHQGSIAPFLNSFRLMQ